MNNTADRPAGPCRPCGCGLLALFLLGLFLGGCTGLPPLQPLGPTDMPPQVAAACSRPFPAGEVRLVHALTAVMPGSEKSTGIGVLHADPQGNTFRSILMTVEGLVLFDIEGGIPLHVHRAVPPFAFPGFPQRMAEDIALAFFRPAGQPTLLGRDPQGHLACRYERPEGETVDVAFSPAGVIEIRLYGAGQALRKRVRIPLLERPGLADELEIQDVSWPGYRLQLRLLEAELVEKQEGQS